MQKLGPASAACPGAYAPESGGTWYEGVDDQRSCGASCTCGAPTGGSCGTSFVRVYGSFGCEGAAAVLSSSQANCDEPPLVQSAQVILQGTTAPSCVQSTPVATGTATPQGAQTLCCL